MQALRRLPSAGLNDPLDIERMQMSKGRLDDGANLWSHWNVWVTLKQISLGLEVRTLHTGNHMSVI